MRHRTKLSCPDDPTPGICAPWGMTSLCYRAEGLSVSGDENQMYAASGVGTVCDLEGAVEKHEGQQNSTYPD
jgi:hypothetical protein